MEGERGQRAGVTEELVNVTHTRSLLQAEGRGRTAQQMERSLGQPRRPKRLHEAHSRHPVEGRTTGAVGEEPIVLLPPLQKWTKGLDHRSRNTDVLS